MHSLQFQGLFGLGDLRALVAQAVLGLAPTGLQRRQRVVGGERRLLRLRGPLLGQRQPLLGGFQIGPGALGLALPLLALRGQGGDLRLHPVARLDDKADFRLEPAHLGVRFV